MKRLNEKLKGGKLLSKTEQKLINGGGPVAFCDASGNCPPNTTCIDGLCYTNGGGGNPPGGCNEPVRFCQEWETGCNCVY